jgi:hypothetical protein
MPTCFVVMGFGKKTDYPSGRVLDLDKSYKYIIKPAAEAAGYSVSAPTKSSIPGISTFRCISGC